MKKIVAVLIMFFVAGCSNMQLKKIEVEMKNGNKIACENGEIVYGSIAVHYYSEGLYLQLRYDEIKNISSTSR